MNQILISLRPKQWIKNLVVFAGLIFSRNLGNWTMVAKVSATFVAFCAVVGAGYLINDILDRESDRVHPIKKDRPIASGRLSVGTAAATAAILVLAALVGGFFVDPWLTAVPGRLSGGAAYLRAASQAPGDHRCAGDRGRLSCSGPLPAPWSSM